MADRITATAMAAILLWVPAAVANDSPCAPIAEAIETHTLRETEERLKASFDPSGLLSHEDLPERLAGEPALLAAMAEPIADMNMMTGVFLARVDIDNDGTPEWWLKTISGSWDCESNWFYRASPPHELIGFVGTPPEDCLSFNLEVVAIDGTNYTMISGDGIRLSIWRAPMTLEPICRVTSKLSGRFETVTDCVPADQPICDKVAELADLLTQDRPAGLAAGRVTDLAAIHVDGQRDDYLSGFGFGEYADVDNDGDQDIFAGNYFQDYRGRQKIVEFGFALIRWIDGGYRRSSALTMKAWFGTEPGRSNVVAYPVNLEGRTYIVLRRHWERGDPGHHSGYTLEIMEIADDESRLVGTVNALSILDVVVEDE